MISLKTAMHSSFSLSIWRPLVNGPWTRLPSSGSSQLSRRSVGRMLLALRATPGNVSCPFHGRRQPHVNEGPRPQRMEGRERDPSSLHLSGERPVPRQQGGRTAWGAAASLPLPSPPALTQRGRRLGQAPASGPGRGRVAAGP